MKSKIEIDNPNNIKVKDKVCLDTNSGYCGIVTKISGIFLYLDGELIGFTLDRWKKTDSTINK